jgi:hypothetical protein
MVRYESMYLCVPSQQGRVVPTSWNNHHLANLCTGQGYEVETAGTRVRYQTEYKHIQREFGWGKPHQTAPNRTKQTAGKIGSNI